MNVICLNVCRLCVPNIMSLGVCFILKNCTRQSWRVCLIQRQNSRYFRCPGWNLKDNKLIKKQTYTKTETCKLYSGVFWIFVPNFIKIDRYHFELYRFKVCAFFWDTVYNVCASDWTTGPSVQRCASQTYHAPLSHMRPSPLARNLLLIAPIRERMARLSWPG